jgi:hypothetical protein
MFFGWVDICMRTETNQQHHHLSNGRRETLEKPSQGAFTGHPFWSIITSYTKTSNETL